MKPSRTTQGLGWILENCPALLQDLGSMESRHLRREISDITIREPVYICGLARSGTTVLLEALAEQPVFASFRYRDFPFVQMPVWWRRLSGMIFDMSAPAVERAHRDRILVKPDSVEAMEEILWMHFFPHIHEVERSQQLTAEHFQPAFNDFYRDTIRKLLWQEKASRYLAKGNYNISRLEYLRTLFPDARFVVPIRDPVTHVASLVKQHKLFCQLERDQPAVLRYMQRSGHFEFGLDRRPMNIGNPEHSRLVQQYFEQGDSVAGYAQQWRVVYQYVQQLKNSDSVKVVRYEDLCADPAETLTDLFRWLQLEVTVEQHQGWQGQFSLPGHDQNLLSAAEKQVIADVTGAVASSFGYLPG